MLGVGPIRCSELLVCLSMLIDEVFVETLIEKVSMGGMSTCFGGDRPAGENFFFVSGQIRPKHAWNHNTDGNKCRVE